MTGRVARVVPIDHRITDRLKANVGMGVFLGSWGISFLGLFTAYVIIWSRNSVWPPPGTPPQPWTFPLANTVIALASSFAYEQAVKAARDNLPALVRPRLLLAGVFGTAFLALQLTMWFQLRQSGFVLGLNNFVGMFYALTMFHAAHVFAGLVMLGIVLWLSRKVAYTSTNDTFLRLSAWFWHFVTVGWLCVFFLLWVL